VEQGGISIGASFASWEKAPASEGGRYMDWVVW